MTRYQNLVQTGRLREDSHQNGISPQMLALNVAVVGVLQKLYQDLLHYKPTEIVDEKASRATGSPVPSAGKTIDDSWRVGSTSVRGVKNLNTFPKWVLADYTYGTQHSDHINVGAT